jgi:hypothetical protein
MPAKSGHPGPAPRSPPLDPACEGRRYRQCDGDSTFGNLHNEVLARGRSRGEGGGTADLSRAYPGMSEPLARRRVAKILCFAGGAEPQR